MKLYSSLVEDGAKRKRKRIEEKTLKPGPVHRLIVKISL